MALSERIEMKRLYLPVVLSLLIALLVAPVAMAAGPEDHGNSSAKANAPGQLANQSEDTDDNGKTFAAGQLKKAEPL